MRKWLTRVVFIAFGIELIYLILANVFLNTSIGPYIVNQNPEKLQLEWSRGWSIVPGQVNAKEVKIRAQALDMQWYLETAQSDFWLRWWKLPLRNFEASSITTQNLSFFVRRRLSDDAATEQSSLIPDIPGLDNPPQSSEEDPRSDESGPWQITLKDVTFSKLKEIWVEQLRFTGEGDGKIGRISALTQGGPVMLTDSLIEFSNATVNLSGQTVASQIQIEMEPTLDPVVLQGASFDQIAAHISGPVSIAGRFKNLNLINNLYQGMPLNLSSEGEINLTANLRLESGKFVPGSELLASANGVVANYLHYTVRGKGVLRGDVSERTGRALTTLTLIFDDFTLSGFNNEPHLKGQAFELVTHVHDVGLADSGQGVRAVATLPESFLPDVTYYNSYLPSRLGIQVQQGSGRLLSQFEFSKEEETVAGEIKLALTDVVAKYESVTVAGHVDVHTILKSGDLKTNHYDAAGTRFELSDVTVSRNDEEIASEWWSKITLGKTRLDFKPAPELKGGIRLRMSDGTPILAIFEEQEDLPDWIKDELNLENLEAEAELLLSDRVLNVTDFELNSGNWALLGDLILKPGGREGILYIKHGELGLAIVRQGEEKKVKLLYGQDWFDAKRQEFRATRSEP